MSLSFHFHEAQMIYLKLWIDAIGSASLWSNSNGTKILSPVIIYHHLSVQSADS